MAANKIIRVGPVALTTTLTTNILNTGTNAGKSTPPVGYTDTLEYIILRHIRIVNKHASVAATFSLYLGASVTNAAGTEVVGFGLAVPVGSAFDWYGLLRLDSADFLVGGSNTATALTFEAEGEIGLV